ncbi:hypothetical protein [Streptomyces thermolilacinus]|uniref:hypothetical protein n=1 Tax=Streptomyces thermolilacinus TaxID=285540 RepID=UPI0033EEE93E
MKKTVVARIVALTFSILLLSGAFSADVVEGVSAGETHTLANGGGITIDWP